jgi:hypothetical protein
MYDPAGGSMYRTWEIEGVKRMSHHYLILAGADWTKRDLAPFRFNAGSGDGGYLGSSISSSEDPNSIFGQNIYPARHYWQWTGKTTFQYQAPYGVNLSSVFKAQKGEPSLRTVRIDCDRPYAAGQTCGSAGGKTPGQGAFDLQVEQSGSGTNFFPTLKLFDISVTKMFNLERLGKVEGSFDMFNLFNTNTILGWKTTSSTTSVTYNGTTSTIPTFHQPTSILSPRIFRLGVRYSF